MRPRNEVWAMLPLHLTTMMYAESQVGVTEDNLNGQWINWGEEVSKYLAAAGLKEPNPWCAALVNWCAEQAAYDHGITSPLESVPLQGYVQSYNDWAKQHAKFIEPSEAGLGDLFVLYFPKLSRYAHIGFVEEVNVAEGWFTTIEGNSNKEGARDGYEVVKRRRNITESFKFIRWC